MRPRRPPLVIIVDDDPDVLNSLKFAFEVEGFEARAYSRGAALIDDQAPIGPACLVLDQQMPGMDGLTLLNQLRARGDNPPAVLITTASAAVRRRAALARVPVVEKPLLCDTLVDLVRQLLESAGPVAPS